MAASRTRSLIFIDDVTVDRNRNNFEVYRGILSAQFQTNAAKLVVQCSTVQIDNVSKHTSM